MVAYSKSINKFGVMTERDRVTTPSNPLLTPAPTKTVADGSKYKPQGFFNIWHGSSFGNWIKLLASGPPIHWSRFPKIASITALSILNSCSNACESVVYGRKIARQKIEHPPIFILGHWRSGTTLLHNLMTLDHQFTFPNLYEVMFPANFLLTERVVTSLTSWLIPKTRPMDNVEAGFHLPQEDEVGLVLLSGLSPYLMLAHPNDRSKYERFFELTDVAPAELSRWKERFLYFIKKLTIKNNKPIVFKSPTHTFRIPLLLEMFPDAKFVYIYRDPYAVYNSSIHLRKTMFVENGLGANVSEETMQKETLEIYTHCMETYARTRHLIPAGNLHELRFEDLEVNPLGEMHRIYQELNLNGWDQVEPAIQKMLPDLTRYQKNSFKMDENLMRKVYSQWKPSFERYGYPSRLPEQQVATADI